MNRYIEKSSHKVSRLASSMFCFSILPKSDTIRCMWEYFYHKSAVGANVFMYFVPQHVKGNFSERHLNMFNASVFVYRVQKLSNKCYTTDA